jgi:class 3 adenylate cyclase/CheY-like chemotaxis protein
MTGQDILIGTGVEIVIVEDSPVQATLLRRMLVRYGYAVTLAKNGLEGLVRVRERKPALVISDIEMPHMDGYALCREIKSDESLRDVPVILLTSLLDPQDIIRGLQAGADNYVTKPYNEQELLARIAYVLANRQPHTGDSVKESIEVRFAGSSHRIDSNRQQILDLLISTFEKAVQQNRELRQAIEEIQRLAKQLELRNKFIRETFGRYITDEVVASLLDSPAGLTLGGEQRKVTILMSDLRGFTSLSGRMAPEQVMAILNRYLGTMVDVIMQYQGTINEFMGDAIFVIFGAPIWWEDHAPRGVACAVAMQLAMDFINQENQRDGLPAVEMGIGVNTGEVVVGNIGSRKRTKYGVVGSHVNLTSRIESYTVGGQILISEATLLEAGPIVHVNAPMQVEAKGIEQPLTLYEVRGIAGAYNLMLPERVDAFVALQQEIPLRYTVVEGKHLEGTMFTGSFVKLSGNGGEVRSTYPVSPLSDLKMRLIGPHGVEIPGDLYGKVVGAPSNTAASFAVRFTSVPPEVVTYLWGFLLSSTSPNA